MKTSVYLSTSVICAVSGTVGGGGIKLKRISSQKIPEGVMFGDNIADVWCVRDILYGIWKRNKLSKKNVNLVINNESVHVKTMNVPVMPPKKIREMIKNEFYSHDAEESEALFDYTVLRSSMPEGGGLILAAGMDSGLVKTCNSIFSDIGVALKSVEIMLPSAIRVTERLPFLKNKTFILSLIEEQTIVNMLFTGGVYRFSNRSTLFEKRGTTSAAVEIARSVSSMIQFNLSEKTGYEISDAYICGLLDEELLFTQDISAAVGVNVDRIPTYGKRREIRRGLESALNATHSFCAIGGLM